MSVESSSLSNEISLPDVAAVVAGAGCVHVLTADGELRDFSYDEARLNLHKSSALVCHAPYTRARLGVDDLYSFDVLELFAFVHPAKFCVPTVHGLCRALGLDLPNSQEDTPFSLVEIARALLSDLRKDIWSAKAPPLDIAAVMGLNGKGWSWAGFVFSALGEDYEPEATVSSRKALNIWKNLPEWAEEAPEPPPSHHGVSADEAAERLAKLLRSGDEEAEIRPQQVEYTKAITHAFAPVREDADPHIVLAEAGTGTGKTLGYLAPASVWAEKNNGAVWISTFTKNLQAQIDQELDRLYPDEALKAAHVAVRKGRENYLCLLNLEDSAAGAALARHPQHAIAAGVMARWAAASKDGDLTGVDFPGWFTGLFGYHQTAGLADRRGECLYSACDHYKRCFVERSVRKADHARIVVANHALVMIQAALAAPGEDLPGRYIFDEGHHIFDAADGAFAAHLSAIETRDMRRWILGAEGGKKTRARGLKKRAEDLVAGDGEGAKLLDDVIQAARGLTGDGWTRRFKDGKPNGTCETFLYAVYGQAMARAEGRNGPYSLETQVHPAGEIVKEQARLLAVKLTELQKPMQALARVFRKRLAEDDGFLDSDMRKRLEAVAGSLERRAVMMVQAWVEMLGEFKEPDTVFEAAKIGIEVGDKSQAPLFVDWFEVTRVEGRSIDVGFYRHYVDPMQPFAASLRPHLHGMAVTSATLLDNAQEDYQDWEFAAKRSGSICLNKESQQALLKSPFDYPAQTKIFVVNDVNKQDLSQVAGAYRALFQASGGGALGLFTAIQRLKSVYSQLEQPLRDGGLTLYGQHVGGIDTGTLVDMFRDDVDSCLLGTDAVRDGVDVPGQSLRMIVYDRVPWPQPRILHRARREAFGGRQYDEMLTRLKLKQAFGRLIRRQSDKGVFVMLDSGLPTRLQSAFPADVEVIKCGLADVVAEVKGFL